jgi:transcriptional regulator with GAF, ATPase, and Fis domain
MGRRNTQAPPRLEYVGPAACDVSAGIRCKISRLRALAEALLAEISRLEAELGPVEAVGALPDEVHRLEASLIWVALAESGWNRAEAARRLGLKPTTLQYKLRQYGLCRTDKPCKR